jgi:hypothetical protein
MFPGLFAFVAALIATAITGVAFLLGLSALGFHFLSRSEARAQALIAGIAFCISAGTVGLTLWHEARKPFPGEWLDRLIVPWFGVLVIGWLFFLYRDGGWTYVWHTASYLLCSILIVVAYYSFT